MKEPDSNPLVGPQLRMTMPRAIALTAGLLVGLAYGCQPSRDTTKVDFGDGDFGVIPNSSYAFDGPNLSTTNADYNNSLGETRTDTIVHTYKLVDRGPGTDQVVCVDKNDIGKEKIRGYITDWAWRFMGDICFQATDLRHPNMDPIYPNNP